MKNVETHFCSQRELDVSSFIIFNFSFSLFAA